MDTTVRPCVSSGRIRTTSALPHRIARAQVRVKADAAGVAWSIVSVVSGAGLKTWSDSMRRSDKEVEVLKQDFLKSVEDLTKDFHTSIEDINQNFHKSGKQTASKIQDVKVTVHRLDESCQQLDKDMKGVTACMQGVQQQLQHLVSAIDGLQKSRS